MKRLVLLLIGATMVAGGCGGDATDHAAVAKTTPTTVTPTTATPSTTAPAGAVEAVVESGTTSSGQWQLVAQSGGRAGVVCAELRGPFRFGGGVCNEPSEQDLNGNDVLRYHANAGDGAFLIGVSRSNVARVRMELRGGASVERTTVAAPFTTAARFVALPTPVNATIRSLHALDSGGKVLTTIGINP
jgi:hypothetical protein